MTKRPPPISDRDLASERARRAREGVPILAMADEDHTAPHHTEEELLAIRRKRPTDERFAHIEKRLDEHAENHKALAAVVHEVANSHSELKGGMRTLIDLGKASAEERERRREEERLAAEAKAKALEARRKHAIALLSAIAGAIAIVLGALAAFR